MRKLLWLIIIIVFLVGCSNGVTQIDGKWKLIYEIDRKGEITQYEGERTANFKDGFVIVQEKGVDHSPKAKFTLNNNKLFLESVVPYEGVSEVYEYTIEDDKLILIQNEHQYVLERVR